MLQLNVNTWTQCYVNHLYSEEIFEAIFVCKILSLISNQPYIYVNYQFAFRLDLLYADCIFEMR